MGMEEGLGAVGASMGSHVPRKDEDAAMLAAIGDCSLID
jgi:hypothetical protein